MAIFSFLLLPLHYWFSMSLIVSSPPRNENYTEIKAPWDNFCFWIKIRKILKFTSESVKPSVFFWHRSASIYTFHMFRLIIRKISWAQNSEYAKTPQNGYKILILSFNCFDLDLKLLLWFFKSLIVSSPLRDENEAEFKVFRDNFYFFKLQILLSCLLNPNGLVNIHI